MTHETKTFTAFCQWADGGGTIWIDTVEASDALVAMGMARWRCAEAWECSPADIHVLGLARGAVDIVHWCDIED